MFPPSYMPAAAEPDSPLAEEIESVRRNQTRRQVVPGVGPDAPTVANEAGAKQSATPYACHLLPARATLSAAAVLHEGAAKYGPDNWRRIPVGEHLNHALTHAFAYLAGDRSDAHLPHAVCRLLFALELDLDRPDA